MIVRTRNSVLKVKKGVDFMDNVKKQIEKVFKTFVEGTLIEQDFEKSLSVISDDVIGIGMGSQGCVSSKEDLIKILKDGRLSAGKIKTTVVYEKMQIRCYNESFGTICGILRIQTIENGEIVKSSLGQMLSVRKEKGKWWIYAVQATPLFNEIEEMEAYPIKFAENALEKYRQQEQIAKNAQNDSVAIYRVNYTKGVFEDAILKSDMVIAVEKGESYEKTLLQATLRRLNDDDGYLFFSTFSISNIIKQYQDGKTEVAMEYLMHLPKRQAKWMKTVVRLYMDKNDKSLKGYLYVFDINDKKLKELALQYRAEHDAMTDLLNKKYAEIKIEEKLKNISIDGGGVFFMIDLDYFKEINDNYGHQEGDTVIKKTAKYINELIGKEDIAGRVGGDEFCIYFQGKLSCDKVEEKANLLCKQINSIYPSGKAKTSCSIGIVYCNSPKLTFKEVYKRADEALYVQKKNGRNGYAILPLDK